MNTLLRRISWLGAAALGVGVISLSAYLFDWRLRWVAIVVLAVAGVTCAAVGLVRRRKAVGEETARSEDDSALVTDRGRAFSKHWKRLIQELRRVKAKGGPDPVAELPWYLLLGEPACGKSAAIGGSGLALRRVPGEQSQEDDSGFCGYLLEHLLLLDVPGRYAVPQSPGDEDEWRALLSHLRRTRRGTPLEGVVLAVSAATLLAGEPTRLEELASALGKRLDEIRSSLGVEVPVYVLVTQCDSVAGMARFFRAFPDRTRTQALGGLNDDREGKGSAAAFGTGLVEELYHRLRELRLVWLGDVPAAEVHPDAFLFPEEYRALGPPLERLLETVFQQTPYRDPPFLRGVHFCSALQQGSPVSRFFAEFGLEDEQVDLQADTRALFVRDFFSTILAAGRGLAAPTARAAGWSRLTQYAGLTAWAAVCLLLAVMLSATFVRDLRAIRTVTNAIPPNPFLGAEFAANARMLEDLRVAVADAGAAEEGRWLPRLGLTQGARLVRQLQGVFCGRFQKGVLRPLDAELELSLDRVAAGAEPAAVARHVDFMTRRANLLQAAADQGPPRTELGTGAIPDYSFLLASVYPEGGASITDGVAEGYMAYLRWQTDARALEQELAVEQGRIRSFLSRRSIGFGWLADWANLQDGLSPVTAEPYWGSPVQLDPGSDLEVARAYTPAGWVSIHTFMQDIAGSMAGEAEVEQSLARFQSNYSDEYLQEWQEFLGAFHAGFRVWSDRAREAELVMKLAADSSPYTRLLSDLPDALVPAVRLTVGEASLPEWVRLVFDFQRLADPEYQRELQGGEGVLSRWSAKGGRLLGDLKAGLRGESDEAKLVKRDRQALPHLTLFQETLKQAAAQAVSPQSAYREVLSTHREAGTVAGEPKQAINRVFWAQGELRRVWSIGNPREEPFWGLLARPAEQVWSVLEGQAEVHLEKLWQETVLSEGRGLGGWELVDALQGANGKVWAFLDQELAPFLDKDRSRGYLPRKLHGSSLHFSADLLRLLSRGKLSGAALQSEYRVQIAALPTDANPGASRQPHRTALILQCNAGPQELVNLNYPITKTLLWTPRSCTETTLEIAIGDVLLVHRYKGYDGFLQFLSEFHRGSRVFRPEEFPEQQAILAGYDVNRVTVSYSFEGQGRALRLTQFRPGSVPGRLFE